MTFLLANWRIIGMALLLAAVGGYIAHCEYMKRELAKAAAIAKAQQQENAKQALRDLKAKERSDENYQRNIARLRADLRRLRDARPSLLPAAPASSSRPDLACFDRGELDAAIRGYREGVLGLVGEGATAVEGLDEAKAWARER